MEVVGATASLMSILQAAVVTTKALVAYAKDTKNASRDKGLLTEEASLLSKLLERLQQRAIENQDDSWLSQQADVVSQLDRAFRDLTKALNIDLKTGEIPEGSRFQALVFSAKWHFSKSEVYGILQRIERLRQYSSSLMSDAQLSIISRVDQQQKEALDRKRLDDILNWLSPLDMNRTHQSISNRVQPGSGKWFLDSGHYVNWSSSEGEADPLWCWGIPGAGKTVLASIVINHLRQSRDEVLRADIGVAVIYLKYNEPEQTVNSLLGSILRQLIQDSNYIGQAVQDLYEHHRQRSTPPPLESILLLLQKTFDTHSETYLIIDGLDECEEETRWDLIDQVNKFPGIHLMVTSRYLSAIEDELENFVRFEIKANKMDMELFIDYQIQRNRNLRRMVQRAPRLKQDIKSAVVKTAENMFLLARLHVESLASAASLTIKHVRQKLQELPTTLEASYDDAVKRITDQEGDHAKLAFKTLAWVTHAFRPFSLRELQHALAIEPGDSVLDEELLMDAPSITALCAGLVVIDKATGNVNLVHYSTKSYFENTRQKYFADYHASITLTLATYLTLGVLQDISISQIVRNYPLASYAAQYLGHHARDSPEESLPPTILETICRLLADPAKRKPLLTLLDGLDLIRCGYYSAQSAEADNIAGTLITPPIEDVIVNFSEKTTLEIESASLDAEKVSIRTRSDSTTTDSTLNEDVTDNWQAKIRRGPIPEVTALHLAASMGLARVASMLLKETPNIDAVDETGKTALTVAMERGFEKAVEFLIKGGALVDLREEHGRMILLLIAEKGWVNAGDILVAQVQTQLDVEDAIADSQLQFILATYRGDLDQVTKFAKSNTMYQNSEATAMGNLALFLAVEHQDVAMVNALIHNGVSINAKDSKGQTALFRATRRQDALMMKLLISGNIEIDSRDDEGRTAWSANVKSRNKDILDILLRNGANPSTRGLQGVSPLYEAATDGDTELVRFMLESGTNPSIQTEYEWAPIHWAASYGHIECVQLLIDAGADVNVRSDQGVTPFDLATQSNQTIVLEMLKQAGATMVKPNPKEVGKAPARYEPPLSAPLVLTPSTPLTHKLFLVFDNPLSRTLVKRTNFGQFLYPRVQKDCPAPDNYIFQVSHVMETSSSTISVRRAVRRAEMDEYPLQLDDFNLTNVLYRATRLRANYQEFELQGGAQTALDGISAQWSSPTALHMHKDWTGNWKVHSNFTLSDDLLFRTTPDWAAQSDSQDCRWITESGALLARSGWDDGTPNMCIEPGLERGLLDLLVACNIVKL